MTKFNHFLLAEDDADDRELFKEALRLVDPAIHLAMVDDGEKLMSHLKTAAVIPDYIFLDLNMPKKNGKECLAEIRQNDQTQGVPVIIYTTSARLVDIEDTFQAGASCFVRKPNTFNDLTALLRKLIHSSSRPFGTKAKARSSFVFNA